jgi:hypothetical protein
MDGIEGLLARDFGVRPQGKAAPMAGAGASRNAAGSGAAWSNPGRSVPAPSAAPSYDDFFGAPAPAPASASSSSFDSLFDSLKGPTTTATTSAKPAPSSAPVFDDDIFDAVPGLRPSKSSSFSARYDDGVFGAAAPAYDDVFATSARSAASPPPPPAYDDDDFLGGFGSAPRAEEEKRRPVGVDEDLLGGFGRKPVPAEEDELGSGGAGFDDLIPGFAGSSPPRSR